MGISTKWNAKSPVQEMGSIRGVVANVVDYHIIVSGFELQSRYYVCFRTNTLDKGMNPLIPLVIGWIASLLFCYKDNFGIK